MERIDIWHIMVQGAERSPNVMYLFEINGIKVCHSMDLGAVPSMEALDRIRNMDMLFVPTGETFIMLIPEVKHLLEEVNPNVIVLMHYREGLSIPISPLDDFLEIIPQGAVYYISNEIDVFRIDIDGMKQCCVFDH